MPWKCYTSIPKIMKWSLIFKHSVRLYYTFDWTMKEYIQIKFQFRIECNQLAANLNIECLSKTIKKKMRTISFRAKIIYSSPLVFETELFRSNWNCELVLLCFLPVNNAVFFSCPFPRQIIMQKKEYKSKCHSTYCVDAQFNIFFSII